MSSTNRYVDCGYFIKHKESFVLTSLTNRLTCSLILSSTFAIPFSNAILLRSDSELTKTARSQEVGISCFSFCHSDLNIYFEACLTPFFLVLHSICPPPPPPPALDQSLLSTSLSYLNGLSPKKEKKKKRKKKKKEKEREEERSSMVGLLDLLSWYTSPLMSSRRLSRSLNFAHQRSCQRTHQHNISLSVPSLPLRQQENVPQRGTV